MSVNYNKTTPSAPSGGQNVIFQTDGTGNISAYVSSNPKAAGADLTAQSAAIAATTIFSVPVSGAGTYLLEWVAKVTTAATTSCLLGGANGFQVKYTDADDSVVTTTPAWWGGGNNGVAPTSAATNTTDNSVNGCIVVNAAASTNIQYLFDYTSVGGTAMQYNLHIRVNYLG